MPIPIEKVHYKESLGNCTMCPSLLSLLDPLLPLLSADIPCCAEAPFVLRNKGPDDLVPPDLADGVLITLLSPWSGVQLGPVDLDRNKILVFKSSAVITCTRQPKRRKQGSSRIICRC